MKKLLWLLAFIATSAHAATILPASPYIFANGTTADANQVNSNFSSIISNTNANAAENKANSSITSLIGLTTPLALTEGGTGQITQTAAFDALSPLTTQGDVLYFNGTDNVRLGAGTAGQLLQTNGNASNPTWVTPAGATVFSGGTSAGSANAQTIASLTPSTGFTPSVGQYVSFIAGNTNTGATTLNVASTGAKNVYRAGSTGSTALTGGEIVASNLVEVVYDGTEYVIVSDLVNPALNMLTVGTNVTAVSPTVFSATASSDSMSFASTGLSVTGNIVQPTGSKVGFGATSPATQIDFEAPNAVFGNFAGSLTPDVLQIAHGTSVAGGHPVTDTNPTVAISRREQIANTDTEGGPNAALEISTQATNSTNATNTIPQAVGLTTYAQQNGNGDVVGTFNDVTQNGTPFGTNRSYTAYAVFGDAIVSGNANNKGQGGNFVITNNTGSDCNHAGSIPTYGCHMDGIVIQSGGTNANTDGIEICCGTTTLDFGVNIEPGQVRTWAYHSPAFGVDPSGNLLALSFAISGGAAGVTCSGTPTSSFASVKGIVTHC